ncbi:hypothetical protein Tco_0462308 [Tanacetum coccineum]
MNVSPIPTTRIDKDHPKDQIIGDLNSAIQTRRMTKIYDEHAMDRKAIGYFLGHIVSFMGFIVYQMDVMSAFLYGTIEDEKKQSRRKQRKDIEVSQSSASTEPMTEKETNEESVPKHSYDPSQSGEDRMQLHELMNLCLQENLLVSKIYRVGSTRRVESSNDEGLGTQEDASKRGRSIEYIDKDAGVSLVDETQRRSDDTETSFDTILCSYW